MIIRKWGTLKTGQRAEATTFMMANSISVRRKISEATFSTAEIKNTFAAYWENYRDNALFGRNNILASICPQVHSSHYILKCVHVIMLCNNKCVVYIPMNVTFFALSSNDPQVYGMHIAKLALAVVLCGGVAKTNETETRVRGEPHLLFIGDPGTGKSQLLRTASRLITRSVFTTGIGTTAAGLTAAAVKVSTH